MRERIIDALSMAIEYDGKEVVRIESGRAGLGVHEDPRFDRPTQGDAVSGNHEALGTNLGFESMRQ